MNLKNLETGEELEAEIALLNKADLKKIKSSKQFIFDWKREYEKSEYVYKLSLVNEAEIVGLMSIQDVREELRINIDLIEVRIDQTGKNKRIENIAGCLIAFTCEKSFEKRYGGFVSLLPKTQLINHYKEKYGFMEYGRMLAIEGQASKNLLNKYLGYEL